MWEPALQEAQEAWGVSSSNSDMQFSVVLFWTQRTYRLWAIGLRWIALISKYGWISFFPGPLSNVFWVAFSSSADDFQMSSFLKLALALLRIFIGLTLIFTLDFLCLPHHSDVSPWKIWSIARNEFSQELLCSLQRKLFVNSYTLTMLILFYFWFRVLKKSSLLPRIKFNSVSGRSASFWLASITTYCTMRNLILTASPQPLPSIQLHGCHPSLYK